MVRNWSDSARAAFDAYPWESPEERARAETETELVSFGERVETGDLPARVRRGAKKNADAGKHVWRGESWKTATETFEKSILEQALAANSWNIAATARALKTTPRIVAYKKRKYAIGGKKAGPGGI